MAIPLKYIVKKNPAASIHKIITGTFVPHNVIEEKTTLAIASVIGAISMAVTSSNLFIQIPRDRSKDVYDRYV